MISEKIGTLLKKNTKTKIWWLKLSLALILSNIFFFVLFSNEEKENSTQPSGIPHGWVEVQLEAQLLTPFQSGKKVLIVQRFAGKKLEAVLQGSGNDEQGRITVLVKEDEADSLFHHKAWEVLPYLKKITFISIKKEQGHEIRY